MMINENEMRMNEIMMNEMMTEMKYSSPSPGLESRFLGLGLATCGLGLGLDTSRLETWT